MGERRVSLRLHLRRRRRLRADARERDSDIAEIHAARDLRDRERLLARVERLRELTHRERGLGEVSVHVGEVRAGARLLAEANAPARVLEGGRIAEAELDLGEVIVGDGDLMEIARALCTDPALLLLDEPAAGLRHKEKQALAAVLRQLKAEGLSILLVEHDMDFVMGLVDRIVVMEFGTRLIEGTPQEVQASPAVRAAYLGTEH